MPANLLSQNESGNQAEKITETTPPVKQTKNIMEKISLNGRISANIACDSAVSAISKPAKNAPKAIDKPKAEVTIAVKRQKAITESKSNSREPKSATFLTNIGATFFPTNKTTAIKTVAFMMLKNKVQKLAPPVAIVGKITTIGKTAKS